MKMLMRGAPWCVLMLLGCSATPDENSPAAGGMSANVSGAAGAPAAGGSVGAAGAATGGAPGAGTGGAPVGPGGEVCGAPPSFNLASPATEAQLSPGAVSLEVNMASESADLTFYLRRARDRDFTIVIMPDTQNYVVDPYNQQHFVKQTQWIVDNRETENIVGVIHNGDLINRPEMMFEWDYAEEAMSILEQPLPGLPDGMPYIVAVGNHEQEPMSAEGQAYEFNRRFGVERFEGRSYYGGHFGEKNDHWYITFEAGSLKFLVMTIEYGWHDGAVYAWMLDVIRAHPDHRVIIDVHELLNSGGSWSGNGENIYNQVKAEPNVELMTCGHNLGESRRTDTFEGHTIHTIMADWQHLDQGGLGRMRMWRFSPATNTMLVRTYSPSFNEEFMADESHFTVPFDMSKAIPEFASMAVVEDASGTVATPTAALDAGTQYEWFVEAKDDCGQVTASEVRTFSTQ